MLTLTADEKKKLGLRHNHVPVGFFAERQNENGICEYNNTL